jgi:hypothetical protein
MSAGATDHGDLRPEAPRTYYDDLVRLPGYREAPNRCRPLSPVGFCEEGHTVLGRSSCGTRYCPDHWRDWIEDAVVSMVARFAAYRHAVDGAEKRWHHGVASPPQDRRYSVRELWETRREAYDALEAAGFRGGATVTHPYRTSERGDTLFEVAVQEGEVEEDTGRWAFLRDLADDWDEMNRYIEAAPHYHVLGPGEDIDGEAAPDDWLVKRIQTAKPFYFRDTEAYRDMVAPAYYVLTHGADQEGKHTTTYFGELHPASFDPEEELTAAVWSRIQMEAEKAVKEEPVAGEGAEAKTERHAGPEECPVDGCEACVLDVMHLAEYMEDEEWVEAVMGHRDGRARYHRLMGVLLWWEGRCDSPPPGASTSEHRFREWLEDRGSVLTPEVRQVSLQTAIMG